MEVGRFFEDAVEGAAKVQKSTEAIKMEFGNASESVLEFGEKTAASMGISTQASTALSARFGILLNNLGIGKDKSAEMTVNLEKLAGSLAAIRGVDPAAVMDKLPLVLAGNLRSMKQLGFAFTDAQIRQEAMKIGALKGTDAQANLGAATEKVAIAQAKATIATQKYGAGSVQAAQAQVGLEHAQAASTKATDGAGISLTASQRALAIYSLATQNLGTYQKQAAAHSGDLINQQRILRAELENADRTIGAALLPAFASMARFLAATLPQALATVGAAIRGVKQVAVDVFNAFAPILRPVIDEVSRLANAFKEGGVREAIATMRDDFEKMGPIGKIVVAVLGGVAAAFVAVKIAALATAGPFTLVVTAVAAVVEAYKRFAVVRQVVQEVLGFVERLWSAHREAIQRVARETWEKAVQIVRTTVELIRRAVTEAVAFVRSFWERNHEQIRQTALKTWAAVKQIVSTTVEAVRAVVSATIAVVSAVWDRYHTQIMAVVRSTWATIKTVVTTAINDVRNTLQLVLDLIHGNWSKVWTDLKKLVGDALDGAWNLVKQAGVRFEAAAQVLGDVILRGLRAGTRPIVSFFTGLWNTVLQTFVQLGKEIYAEALRIALKIIEPFSKIPWKGGEWARKMKDGVQAELDSLKDEAKAPAAALASTFGDSLAAGLQAPLKSVSDAIIAALNPPGVSAAAQAAAAAAAAGMGAAPGGASVTTLPPMPGNVVGKSLAGVVPQLAADLAALAKSSGQVINITSAVRSFAQQKFLWDNAARLGLVRGVSVAAPGTSEHERGRAVDATIGGRPITDVISSAILAKFGLAGIGSRDPVHIQLAGSGATAAAGTTPTTGSSAASLVAAQFALDAAKAKAKADLAAAREAARQARQEFLNGWATTVSELRQKITDQTAATITALRGGLEKTKTAIHDALAAGETGARATLEKTRTAIQTGLAAIENGIRAQKSRIDAETSGQIEKAKAVLAVTLEHIKTETATAVARINNDRDRQVAQMKRTMEAAVNELETQRRAKVARINAETESIRTQEQSALDAVREKYRLVGEDIQNALADQLAKIQAKRDAARDAIDATRAQLTPAEALVKQEEEAHAAAGRTQSLADAQKNLNDLQKSGTATADQLAQANQSVADAQYAIKLAADQSLATQERLQKDADAKAAQDAADADERKERAKAEREAKDAAEANRQEQLKQERATQAMFQAQIDMQKQVLAQAELYYNTLERAAKKQESDEVAAANKRAREQVAAAKAQAAHAAAEARAAEKARETHLKAVAKQEKEDLESQLEQAKAKAKRELGDAKAAEVALIAHLRAVAKEDAKAAAEREKADEVTTRQRATTEKNAFAGALRELKTHLSNVHASWSAAHAQILDLFAKTFQPDYESWGGKLGKAFADGIRSQAAAVGEASRVLAAEAAKYLRLKSPAEKGPLSELDTWWSKMGETLAASAGSGVGRGLAGALAFPGAGPVRAGSSDLVRRAVKAKQARDEVMLEELRRQTRLLEKGTTVVVPTPAWRRPYDVAMAAAR